MSRMDAAKLRIILYSYGFVRFFMLIMVTVTGKDESYFFNKVLLLPFKKHWREIEGVPVFQYLPSKKQSESPSPCLVYIHGGGWVMSHIVVYHTMLNLLAKKTNMMIISIDYRLAPSHPFPASHNDCYNVSKYLLQHAEEMGIDSEQLYIAGDSAGANMSLCTCLRLCDEQFEKNFKKQILINGCYQFVDKDLPSYKKGSMYPNVVNIEDIFKLFCCLAGKDFKYGTKLIREGFLDNFKPIEYRESKQNKHKESSSSGSQIANIDLLEFSIDPLVFPLMRTAIPASLPECHVIASSFDWFHSDSDLLHEKLKQNCCKSQLTNYETIHCPHLNCGTPFSVKEGERMLDDIAAFLQS